MRAAVWSVLLAIVLVISFYLVVIIASESGEVVILATGDGGEATATRLWIVDYNGAEWVRTGHSNKGWYRRITSDPKVSLERNGLKSRRLATVVMDTNVAAGVNAAFSDKYGIADKIVALSGDARKRIPVRLDQDK